ncbi:major facilitator superfamily protein [Advenella kashmirensis WT001]|uniref:Major facilitator superfamily protein n=1 Tax=Advenella kashmirensis (strain DSM 17095 / LMG 22695 / WT001) TaxID=1036672 RepID=I3UF17_ADVKW|nr:MFS transporter [Advenella kashmirensis]AFK63605.1 major facilitator superfamily protein [Advenella kashmirensis WT001]
MNNSSTATSPSLGTNANELKATYAKIAWRLIPFLVFLFILAWLDRVNVGFAKLHMLQDLQFSEAVYGLGAGIFFIGYFLFEVPSNLLLEKIGARKTLARITILWGAASIGMAYVTTPTQFYIMRFLLGVFEAGFFPGVVLYLTYWFPAEYRARVNGLFMTSFALAGVVGGPLAGLILNGMQGVGHLANWQWLFILEGIPSVIAGMFVLKYLPEKPVNAKWLTPQEQQAVTRALELENSQTGNKHLSFKDAYRNSAIWLCAAVYFCIVSGNATIAFWSPSIIKAIGINNDLMIGVLSALPFIAGTIAMVWNGAHSDKTGERRMHCAVATLIACLGLVATGMLLHNALFALIALTIASVGILAAFPVFWSIPAAFLAGTAAAGGIALINSIGNLAGFVAPYMIGSLKTSTGSLSSGLYFVAALEILASILVILFVKKR